MTHLDHRLLPGGLDDWLWLGGDGDNVVTGLSVLLPLLHPAPSRLTRIALNYAVDVVVNAAVSAVVVVVVIVFVLVVVEVFGVQRCCRICCKFSIVWFVLLQIVLSLQPIFGEKYKNLGFSPVLKTIDPSHPPTLITSFFPTTSNFPTVLCTQ